MKFYYFFSFSIVIFMLSFSGCQNSNSGDMVSENRKKVLFLHHSTGKVVWQGGNDIFSKVKGKLGMKGAVEKWFNRYNRDQNVDYEITEMAFPKKEPYGWNNYPFDYYNIWVKHGDQNHYMEEPTLKVLTPEYDLIIFKHCFPSSRIVTEESPDIDSERKTIENYKLQYAALKEEMRRYPDTRFLVWTPPALTEQVTNIEAAEAANGFARWMIEEWDEPEDNIFIWDFRTLETGGGPYLLPENAVGEKDSHPSHKFARNAYPLFCQRIVDVLDGQGDERSLTGK